jgi:predicted PurR-regulated permease PerM
MLTSVKLLFTLVETLITMFKKSWILPVFTLGLICVLFLIFRSVLSYVLISAILALITSPLFLKLKKIHFKSITISPVIAALLSITTLYAVVFSLIMIFIPSIVDEAKIITKINPQEALNSVQQPIEEIEDILNTFTEEPVSLQQYATTKVTSLINVSSVSGWINTITAFTGNLFISFFAITFITFFFLKDSTIIIGSMQNILPFTFRDEASEILVQVKSKLTRYFIGLCVEILLVFTINTIGLWTIGIENFLIIALFAGVINVIPYIGPLIGMLFGAIIVITTNYQLGWENDLMPLLGYTAIIMISTQLLDNFIFQPFIYSNSVNAHPLEIFLVILVAGNLYGIIGMMVAIPSYSVLRVIIKEIRDSSKFLNDIYDTTE